MAYPSLGAGRVPAVVKIVESNWFQRTITGLIIFTGVLVGAETYPWVHDHYFDETHAVHLVVLGIFTLEILLKVIAEGSKPWRFFRDPWNCFDFVVVGASFLPMGEGHEAIVALRLLRLLRVLRLVTALPRLQLLVSALVNSLPSQVYVTLLLSLLFYIYGVAAVFLFGRNDPIHFSSLHLSILSLFRVVTLEDWTDIMYIQMYGCENYGYAGNEALCTQSTPHPILGALFFVSFVLLGTMIVLNLFIGVIMNGMSEAHNQAEDERRDEKRIARGQGVAHVDEELAEISAQLAKLQASLSSVQRRASRARELSSNPEL